MFMALTWLDLFAFATAIILFFVLFRTVTGFRIRSTGINKEAAESLGIKAESLQIRTVAFSGLLSGIGGCLLVMGGVTMFMQDITAGRGFLALAAGNMGAAHPLGVIASSAFFGFAQALSNILQNTAFPNELTLAVPFAATIVALMLYNYMNLKRGRDIG